MKFHEISTVEISVTDFRVAIEDDSPFYFHLITSRPEIHERWPWKNSIRPSYDSMGGPGYYKTSSEATEETKWLLSQPRVVVRE